MNFFQASSPNAIDTLRRLFGLTQDEAIALMGKLLGTNNWLIKRHLTVKCLFSFVGLLQMGGPMYISQINPCYDSIA